MNQSLPSGVEVISVGWVSGVGIVMEFRERGTAQAVNADLVAGVFGEIEVAAGPGGDAVGFWLRPSAADVR